MMTTKKATLKPVLESAEGVHLTAYLVNRGDLVDLKSQLREVLDQALDSIEPVMAVDERARFLEPIEGLLLDASLFSQMKGNIGIFRTQELFRIINIPIDVELSCHVATSFHVKPLLRWLQSDQEFLLLGLTKESAQLYLGSQDSLKLIDSIRFARTRPRIREEEVSAWMKAWINILTKSSKVKLFIAGEKGLSETLIRNLKHQRAIPMAVAKSFTPSQLREICQGIREVLKQDTQNLLERTLQEFRLAEDGHRTRKNIFQIARAVVDGRVRKLIVTDELSIFGKIDRKSGGLSLHPFDMDHEDDDILDDLAQMVLNRGGEVVVAARNEMPKGRPILAILDDDGEELKLVHESQYEDLQERI